MSADEESQVRRAASAQKRPFGLSWPILAAGAFGAAAIVGLTASVAVLSARPTTQEFNEAVQSAQQVNQCPWRFDPQGQMPAALQAALEADTIQPSACDTCVPGEVAVWVAPGDLCSLAQAGFLVRHPGTETSFCDRSRYTNNYDPRLHFKTCLEHSSLTWLWDNQRCRMPTASTDASGNVTLALDTPWVQRDGAMYCGWWSSIFCGGCNTGVAKIFELAAGQGLDLADEAACDAIGDGTAATACEIILGGPEDPAADACAAWVTWAISKACGKVIEEIVNHFAEGAYDAIGEDICQVAGGC
jgi:hypothetical protein